MRSADCIGGYAILPACEKHDGVVSIKGEEWTVKELLRMIRARGQSTRLANFQGGLEGRDLIEPRPEESDLVASCDRSRDPTDGAFGFQRLADDLRHP